MVVGHCIPDASSPTGISMPVMKIIHAIIYSFHMPLFFFISGFLFPQSKIAVSNKLDLIITRAKRLMVPYFFVGLCYAPMKLLLSNFANKPYDLNNFWKIIIGVNPDGELWFLYALFIITIVAILINEHVNKFVLSVAAVLAVTAPILPIVTGHIFYFLVGMYMRSNCLNFITNSGKKIVALNLIVFISINCISLMNGKLPLFHLLTAVSGTYLCIYFSWHISMFKNDISKMLCVWGIYSMDIYILSDIIKIPFRILLWNKLHLYITAFLVCTVAAIGISYFASKYIIRKNSWLKKFIIGC